jgi:hypothetical protein
MDEGFFKGMVFGLFLSFTFFWLPLVLLCIFVWRTIESVGLS